MAEEPLIFELKPEGESEPGAFEGGDEQAEGQSSWTEDSKAGSAAWKRRVFGSGFGGFGLFTKVPLMVLLFVIRVTR